MVTNSFIGAVCYIDLLGFSYLTTLLNNNEIFNDKEEEISFEEKQVKDLTLNDLRVLSEYIKFGSKEKEECSSDNNVTISDWAYGIVDKNLKSFHTIVQKQCKQYSSVKKAAISDSMFIVSEKTDDLLMSLANIFRDCIKSGIMLRAGLSYGPYYTVKTSISELNVYGAAVTKAVSYEKKGKGCRVFTDSDFAKSSRLFSEVNSQIFYPYKNHQNYSVLDCFEYLMIKDDYVLPNKSVRNLRRINPDSKNKAIDLIFDNYEVECALRYSPDFAWNLKNSQGIEQLGASIEYVCNSIDNVFEICLPPDEQKRLSECIKDGFSLAKEQKRSKEIVDEMIRLKKKELKDILRSPRETIEV